MSSKNTHIQIILKLDLYTFPSSIFLQRKTVGASIMYAGSAQLTQRKKHDLHIILHLILKNPVLIGQKNNADFPVIVHTGEAPVLLNSNHGNLVSVPGRNIFYTITQVMNFSEEEEATVEPWKSLIRFLHV